MYQSRYIKFFKSRNLHFAAGKRGNIFRMVIDEISIKKSFSFKKLFLFFLAVVLISGIIYLSFLLGAIFGKGPTETSFSYENPVVELMEKYATAGIEINETEIIKQAELEFDKNYINYVLFAMSAWKLHNSPLSRDTPKIKIVLDNSNDEIYYSEVIGSEIKTDSLNIGEPDVIISTSKQEIIEAMLAEDMIQFMKTSVMEGGTNMEMMASQFTLASKGYLQMYEDVTGESLLGSVIRM